jgi:predicted amidohydrolase
LVICYDLFSPEIARYLALEGAEIILCPSASPGVRQGFFETFTQSRSMENAVFVVYVNQCGIHEDLTFWGGSEVRDPAGASLLKLRYDAEDFGVAELDLSADLRRIRPFVPTLRDQPGWLYVALNEAHRLL